MNQLVKLKRTVIKQEFVALTNDYVKAVILNQFIYWSERVRDFDTFVEEEKFLAQQNGNEINIERKNGWIYKSCEELSEEIMIKLAPSNMRNHIKYLVENGWLDERLNPDKKWDRRKQYRVNLLKIHKDLLELGYYLQDYRIDMSEVCPRNPFFESKNACAETENAFSETKNGSSEMKNRVSDTENRTSQNEKAISEITTEITTKIISENTSVCQSISGEPQKTGIGQTDLDRYKKIITNCQLPLMQKREATAVEEAVQELFFNVDFAAGTLNLPLELVRNSLDKLNYGIAMNAIFKMKKAAAAGTRIESSKHYLMKCIYNNISEFVTDLFADQNTAQEEIYDPSKDICYKVKGTEFEKPLELIRSQMAEITFNTWFGSGIFRLEREGQTLIIVALSEVMKNILLERYNDLIIDSFRCIGISNLQIEVDENIFPLREVE